MAKDKSGGKQVNQYDKILKENLEGAIPGLIKDLLCIDAVSVEEIPDDIQHTKERKPDVLKKVIDDSGEKFVLHIEFQLKDEAKMIFRMAEYWVMLYRKYNIPVRQYVIYIGTGIPDMADHIHSGRIFFHYALIALSTVDYRLLLCSDKPEEKMLAILANFGNKTTGSVIKDIVTQIIETATGDLERNRFLQQLRILAQLRNLGSENLKIMDSIANYISEEKDILYRRGEIKGMEKGMEKGIEKGIKKGQEIADAKFVRYLLTIGKHSDKEIVALTGVSEAFVKQVKEATH